MFPKAKKFRIRATFLMLLLAAPCALAQDAPSESVTISVVAVQATTEGNRPKHFDRSIAHCKKSLVNLSYDTFREVKIVSKAIPLGKKTRVPINDRYTLHLSPIQRQPDGRMRFKAIIAMKKKPDGKTVNALETTLSLPPGKPSNLGGMKLKKGDLVIVLSVGSKPTPK